MIQKSNLSYKPHRHQLKLFQISNQLKEKNLKTQSQKLMAIEGVLSTKEKDSINSIIQGKVFEKQKTENPKVLSKKHFSKSSKVLFGRIFLEGVKEPVLEEQ